MTTERPIDASASRLGQTVPAEAFSQEGLRRHLASTVVAGPTGSDPALALVGESLVHRLRPETPDSEPRRFEIGSLLGAGATGAVFSVVDRDLKREIAVKLLESDGAERSTDIDHFISEAQITASLEHPNVLPVHDISVTARGQVYFSMKRIEGESLGSAIALSTSTQRAPRIASFNALVGIVISIGHAIAFAHHRGIVHQDIKPDNIMLGDFGEILLVDWGSATRVGDPAAQLYGTPLYMSPEQARLERSDPLSDVYCLGATLFHALTLRCPTWSDDPDEFWVKKRAGVIDPPTAAERAALPAPLIDIALKALASDPKSRYPSVDALIEDLQRYQSGLAVSAHRDSVGERWARWYRNHRRALWAGTLIGAVIVTLVGLLYGERLKEIATWGEPVFAETFDDDRWQGEWRVLDGTFERRDGRMASTARGGAFAVLTRKFWGDTAVEYDGQILPGSNPCDISMIWMTDLDPANLDGTVMDRLTTYRVQVGMIDNSYSAITYGERVHLAYSDFRPQVGVTYRIRIEIVDNRLTLLVDGTRICEYVDPFPVTGGYIGLYGYYPGKAFDNVRVYSRGIPEKVAATAIGDSYMQNRLYAKAEEQYAKVAATHGGSEISNEALYKQGLARYRQGQHDEAFALWARLGTSHFAQTAGLHRLDRLFAEDRHEALLSAMERLYQNSRADTRVRITLQWSDYTRRLTARSLVGNLVESLTDYLAVRDRAFPHENTTDRSAAEALSVLGRFQEVLDRFPNQVAACANALAFLGREEEVLERFSRKFVHCEAALLSMGRMAELERQYPDDHYAQRKIARGEVEWAYAQHPGNEDAMIRAGRSDLLLSLPKPATRWHRHRALIFLGRTGELSEAEQQGDVRVLMAQGRGVEAHARYGSSFHHGMWPRHLLGLEDWMKGDRASAERHFGVPPGWEFHQSEFFMAHYVMVPFLRQLDGDRDAMARACAQFDRERRYVYQQQPWHCAQLLMGRMTEEQFLAQEYRIYAPANLQFCRAILFETAGRHAAALESYRSYLAFPAYLRSDTVDPVLERFVAWRMAECAKNP
ncbi:MAG: protein kinase [Planctomycetes bacterium]|nr:protein kinase [Planctomycetota bacterium]